MGISDDGGTVVGYVGSDGVTQPFVFASAGGTPGPLHLPDGYYRGLARDVNDAGASVGWMSGSAGTRATVWTGTGPETLPLPDGFDVPGNRGWASGINNQGWIAGEVRMPAGDREIRHAVVWLPSGGEYTVCDLDAGVDRSSADGITDVSADGKALVAGGSYSSAVVWEVQEGCQFSPPQTMGSATGALDVTGDAGSWQAVGTDHLFHLGKPIVWMYDGTGVTDEVLHDGNGRSFVITGDGNIIVGWRKHKGAYWATLWTQPAQ
jgi:hypothetical protein